jgi:glycosyltransferase involved in cell wall biosynthesis
LKILIVTIEPPLPFSTAAAKWFYVLINELRARGHEVVCISTCSKKKDMEEARKLFPNENELKLFSFPSKRNFIKKMISLIKPFSYMFSDECLIEIEKQIQNGSEVIHIEQLWAGWGIPKKFRPISLLNIHHLVTIDLEERKRNNLRDYYEYFQTERAEKNLISKFYFHRFFTERLSLKSKNWKNIQSKKEVVIPFSLDKDLYPFITDYERTRDLSIGMIASMGWHPGKSAAHTLLKSIHPKLIKENDQIKLFLAGWNARIELKDFIGQEGVSIEENVKSVRDFMNKLKVFVYIPSKGSGMKIKVLEAMLFGIPVITTTEGIEGLPAKNGIHALISDDLETLYSYTKKLLDDDELANQLRKNARTLIETYCDKKIIVDQLETLYTTIRGH